MSDHEAQTTEKGDESMNHAAIPLPSADDDATPPGPAAPTRGTVLVVDDELAVVRVYARALRANGYRVLIANDGETAEVMFRKCGPDVVVTDLCMPGMDGFHLMRAMRKIDPGVPVLMATGDHHDEAAKRAVDGGALMFMVKPVDLRALCQLVAHATQLHRRAAPPRAGVAAAAPTRQATGAAPTRQATGDGALAARFDSALKKLWIAFQPIVHWTTQVAVGHEALVRSDEPELADPGALFGAAEKLGRTRELGRAIRARVASCMSRAPEDTRMFVNLHSDDLRDDALYGPDDPLRPFAARIVLEVSERDSLTKIASEKPHLDKLRALGFRIAIDDLGAGYAGLGSFAELKPSVVKLDACLVRDINHDPVKQQIVEAVAQLCRNMNVEMVAEGVETDEESHALGLLGCPIQQGFFYAVPRRLFAAGA